MTEVLIIIDTMRTPNPIIVLLYIQNSHTKMQAKYGSKKSHAINLAKFGYFVIFARFEVTFFWTPPSKKCTEMTPQLPDIEN